jgi:hypothetical protein
LYEQRGKRPQDEHDVDVEPFCSDDTLAQPRQDGSKASQQLIDDVAILLIRA